MKVVRGVSGTLAGGLFVLTLVVVGAAIMAAKRDFPGPGSASVSSHLVASMVAIGAQVFSDRHRGFAAFSGSVIVIVTAAVLLWTQWWS